MKENRASLVFVSLLLTGLLCIFVAELGIPTSRLLGYGLVLLFEAWACLNTRKSDTISEAFWELSSRPLLPWVSGMLTAHFVTNGTLTSVVEIGALVGIQSHFFWQSASVYSRLQKSDAGYRRRDSDAI